MSIKIPFIFFLIACCLVASTLPTPSAAHQEIKVIKIVPSGFEPQSLTVDQNSTVIFKNEDVEPRWPASDIHPTHDLYPEFDPKHELAPGESWSFKPTKSGTWKYHDHLKPHIRGTLTVASEGKEGLVSPIDPQPSSILDKIGNFLNHIISIFKNLLTPKENNTVSPKAFKEMAPNGQFETLEKIAQRESSQKAWEFIKETYKNEAGSSGNIHDLAHLAGKLLYEQNGIKAISFCTTQFAFGCYHGLLDTAFKDSLADLPQAETACETIGPINSGPYGSCIHGIGHGIASFNETRDIKKALSNCDKLNSGHEFCWDGVFMEFVRGAPQTFYQKDNPLYPCDALEREFGAKYSFSCGRNQPTAMISRLEFAYEDVIKVCTMSKSEDFKNACFDSLGFMAASARNAEAIIKACSKIPEKRLASRCLQAAAGELIFQDVPGWQGEAPKVCNASGISYRKSCNDHLENLIRDYGKTTEQNFKTLNQSTSKDEFVKSNMKVCFDSGGKDDCYQKAAHTFSGELGLKETLAIFAKNEDSPEIYSRCHEATHYLSRDEYQKQGSIAKVYAQCNSTCHGGCYHGTLEAYLKEKQEGSGDFSTGFPKICGKREDYSSLLVYNECLHGLGHAAMFVTDMEVPQSLALCDSLTEKDPQERCFSGVFMENSSSSTSVDHPGKYTKVDDPLYPCNTLDQKYQQICYRYQSSYFALIANHDWKKVADLCLSVPNEYQNDCFRTVGTNQVGFTQDTKIMKNNCELMPTEEFRNTCVAGIISSFAYRFVGDNKRMEDFCESVPGTRQEACFRQMGTAFADWTNNPTNPNDLCDRIKNPLHNSWCKGV